MNPSVPSAELHERDLAPDPFQQFEAWFQEAASREPLPNAMSLATSTPAGIPSVRLVLLKGVIDGSLHFYTNYTSPKAVELDENPEAAVAFFWPSLQRQVRVDGSVERLPDDVSDEYFQTRPRGSQIGAWASPQSEPIKGREELEQRFAAAEKKIGDGPVSRPPFWGGYRLLPRSVEFWQGRESRLHDRLRYRLQNGTWVIDRLAP